MYVIALFRSAVLIETTGSGAQEQIRQCLSVHPRDVTAQHGASELYVTTDLNIELSLTCHLSVPGLKRVCKMLSIDFAPAMIGTYQ